MQSWLETTTVPRCNDLERLTFFPKMHILLLGSILPFYIFLVLRKKGTNETEIELRSPKIVASWYTQSVCELAIGSRTQFWELGWILEQICEDWHREGADKRLLKKAGIGKTGCRRQPTSGINGGTDIKNTSWAGGGEGCWGWPKAFSDEAFYTLPN